MEKTFKGSAMQVETIFQNVDKNTIEACNIILRLAYPDYTLKGFADPDNEPASPTLNDCYLVSADATVWGIESLKDNIIWWDGTQWSILPYKVNDLQQGITSNWLETLQENLWFGVEIPTNGSQTLSRTGYSSWGETPPFLSDIALVLLADNLTENAVLATWSNPKIPDAADLTGASGQVMVRFKKFYYREIFNDNQDLIEIRWSAQKLPGFQLHPFFSDGTNEADYAYISAYEAGDDGGTKLKSASGVAPLTSVALPTFRNRAVARGSGWHAYDFWAQHLIQMYFYLYYASLDSQGELPGYTEASAYDAAYKRLTGRSNILTSMNGSIDAILGEGETDEDLSAVLTEGDKIANRFLFIENIFGHIWKMLDGVSFDGRIGENNTVFLSKNPADYSSVEANILADYENLNINLSGLSGYIGTVHSGFIPKTIAGNSSSYFGDYLYSNLDDEGRDYLRLVRAGGVLSNGVAAGVAYRASALPLGSSDSAYGSRLCAKKFNV